MELGGVSYDYGHTSERVTRDRITVRLHIGGNNQLTSFENPIDTRIDVYSLRDSKRPVRYVYRKLLPTDEWQDVHIEGWNPRRFTSFACTSTAASPPVR